MAASSLLQDVINNNSLLSALSIKDTEKIIAIRENDLADANFVLTNIMKQFFAEEDCKMCFVILHNTIGHYQNVGKRLGYDLLQKIQDGSVVTIEPLKAIVDAIGNENVIQNVSFLSQNKEAIVKELFLDIRYRIEELLKSEDGGRIYLVIDDISHLLDLGIDTKYVVSFVRYCVNFASKGQVCVVINCHVSNKNDEIVSNVLSYGADLNIEVSPLKTGMSHDVTGIITLRRNEQNEEELIKGSVFHYKAYDRDIKTFAPGESLYRLYK